MIICKQNYKCEICKKIYKTCYNLKYHKCSNIINENKCLKLAYQCQKCKKDFTKGGLQQHKTKVPNCTNKCYICLKKYTNQQTLKRHESVACKQRYECVTCDKIYNEKYDLKYHKCIDNKQENVSEIIPNIKNNIDNKKLMIKNNFLESQPKWLDFGYDEEKHKNYSEYNEEFTEEMADMYMYEEDKFKEKYKEEIVLFEKKTLELEGFKMLHTELQKDLKYQNVRIKKSKSGKCHIYNRNGWEEIALQKGITKVCSKLCNSLYDKETSVNQFLNLVIGSQPRRMTDLRKHIEQNIMDLNKIPLLKNEIKEINHA